jgi:hypothetical protein
MGALCLCILSCDPTASVQIEECRLGPCSASLLKLDGPIAVQIEECRPRVPALPPLTPSSCSASMRGRRQLGGDDRRATRYDTRCGGAEWLVGAAAWGEGGRAAAVV